MCARETRAREALCRHTNQTNTSAGGEGSGSAGKLRQINREKCKILSGCNMASCSHQEAVEALSDVGLDKSHLKSACLSSHRKVGKAKT